MSSAARARPPEVSPELTSDSLAFHVLVEAESELELPAEGGPHGFRPDDPSSRGVAQALAEEGLLKETRDGEYEITDRGQIYVLEMVGIR